MKDPKDSTRTNKLWKVARYKINIQNQVASLYQESYQGNNPTHSQGEYIHTYVYTLKKKNN